MSRPTSSRSWLSTINDSLAESTSTYPGRQLQNWAGHTQSTWLCNCARGTAQQLTTELTEIHNGTIYSAQWLTTEPARINNGNMYSSQELISELKEIHIRRSAEGDPQKYEYMYRRECLTCGAYSNPQRCMYRRGISLRIGFVLRETSGKI